LYVVFHSFTVLCGLILICCANINIPKPGCQRLGCHGCPRINLGSFLSVYQTLGGYFHAFADGHVAYGAGYGYLSARCGSLLVED
jgi:hypothetical protein